MNITWPKGDPAFYRRVRSVSGAILGGTLVTIDPSIGSSSSQPGYALFYRGALQKSGTVFVQPRLDVYKRARILFDSISVLLPSPPDVLGIEGLGQWANVKTIWGAGLAIAATDAGLTIEIPIPFWKAYAKQVKGARYFKDDEQDAIVMGEALIAYCRGLEVANGAA